MRSPLSDLHNALYTALDGVSGLTAYSFVPASVSFPYAYIERKQSRPVVIVKSTTEHRIRVKLVIATNDKDISVIEGLIDSIEQALSSNLALSNDWNVIRQSQAPEVDVFPGTNFDGSQGHAADVFYNFDILDTQ